MTSRGEHLQLVDDGGQVLPAATWQNSWKRAVTSGSSGAQGSGGTSSWGTAAKAVPGVGVNSSLAPYSLVTLGTSDSRAGSLCDQASSDDSGIGGHMDPLEQTMVKHLFSLCSTERAVLCPRQEGNQVVLLMLIF